ncbi:uncharacterized protein [Palaemon carinicauda]|uniref:uncharacterized protein n=1 Tax=Palaemon carinicauda TaxID=392227 RepID=UPI0035B5D295
MITRTILGLLFLVLCFRECLCLTLASKADELGQYDDEEEVPSPIAPGEPLLSNYSSEGLSVPSILALNAVAPPVTEISSYQLVSVETVSSPSPSEEPISSPLYQTKLSSLSAEPPPSSLVSADPLSMLLPQPESTHLSSLLSGSSPVTTTALPQPKIHTSKWSREDLRVLAFAAFFVLLLPFLVLWVVTVRDSASRVQRLYTRLGSDPNDLEDTAF